MEENKNTQNTNNKEPFNETFNYGTFGTTSHGGYNLPVTSLNENGKLEIMRATSIQFVSGEKIAKRFALLKPLNIVSNSEFELGYIEEGEVVTFVDKTKLIKIPAKLGEDGSYLLGIELESGNAGITMKPEQVIRLDDTIYLGENNNLDVACFAYGVWVETLIPAQEGILIESLLNILAFDLEIKNKELPCLENVQAIINIKQAAHWLAARKLNHKNKLDAK